MLNAAGIFNASSRSEMAALLGQFVDRTPGHVKEFGDYVQNGE